MTEGLIHKTSGGKQIVVAVTGAPAAYKAVDLVRQLRTRGYEVQVLMNKESTYFVSPRTFEIFSENTVIVDQDRDLFVADSSVAFKQLVQWASAVVIAPASVDCIASLSQGRGDNFLSSFILATTIPVLVAPAMSETIFHNPMTQANIALLRNQPRFTFSIPLHQETGSWENMGQIADTWQVFSEVERLVAKRDFQGMRVIVTTGGTQEAIDPSRYIANRSSGKMGVAVARELYRRGAEVTVIHTPMELRVPHAVRRLEVFTAEQMKEQVLDLAYAGERPIDVLVMAAAVTDFKPTVTLDRKIKREDSIVNLSLEATPDILSEVARCRSDNRRPLLVGFSVEVGDFDLLLPEIRQKMSQKGADLMVAQLSSELGEPEANRAVIIDRYGHQNDVLTTYKSRVAGNIVDALVKLR